MAALLTKLAANPELQKIASNAAGNIVSGVADASKPQDTVAEIPTANAISAATISAKSDDIFVQIGEKLCSSMQEIVENKQYMIIDNINKTITKHLESDSVKNAISKKIEEVFNAIPNKEELIKNVNERIKETVNKEIEKTFTNPDTFEQIKQKLKFIVENPTVEKQPTVENAGGGTRKYKSKKNKKNKINKRKQSLKLKKIKH
jgi:hypothetical protein